MIGYSDSNKDARLPDGQLGAAARAAHARRASAAATACALTLFHGRGGTVGPRRRTDEPRRSSPSRPESVGGRLRSPSRARSITNRYASRDLAERHLEQLVHAVLVASLSREPARPVARGGAGSQRSTSRRRRGRAGLPRASCTTGRRSSRYFARRDADRRDRPPQPRQPPCAAQGRPRPSPTCAPSPGSSPGRRAGSTLPGWYGLGSALAGWAGDDDARWSAAAARCIASGRSSARWSTTRSSRCAGPTC